MKETTNIGSIPEFSHRKVNITYAGAQAFFNCTNDYLVNDFTFKELMDAGVKLRNRKSKRNPYFNDMFLLMRIEEVIDLMLDLNSKALRIDRVFKTGLYIETKFVQFYLSKNFNLPSLLYDILKKYDIETVNKATHKLPVIIQSFEEESLILFNFTDLPKIHLLSPDYEYDLKRISTFAHGVGPKIAYLFNYKDENFNLDKPSLFIQECHNLSLLVHPWTLQDDALQYSDNSIEEVKILLHKGIDGIFSEYPSSTLQAMEYILEKQKCTEI